MDQDSNVRAFRDGIMINRAMSDVHSRAPLERMLPQSVIYVSPRRLQKEHGSGELQPIGNRRGLVASENYSVYKPEGQKYKVLPEEPTSQRKQTRSQPNSTTQEPEPVYRQSSSAPIVPKEPPPPLPKINNLVRTNGNSSPSKPAMQPTIKRHAGITRSQGPDDKWATTINGSRPRNDKPGPKKQEGSTETIKEKIERENTKETIYMGGPSPQRSPHRSPQRSPTKSYLGSTRKSPYQSPTRNPNEHSDGSEEAPSPIPSPRREATKAQLNRIKHVLLMRAKTQDALKIQRTKTQVAKVAENSVEKEMAEREKDLYKLEDAMHIYFQDYLKSKSKNGIDPSESPRKKNPDQNRSVPPWLRKEYVLSKRETEQYNKISSIYGTEMKENKKKREENFYKKCLQLQVEAWRRLHEEHAAKKRHEAKTREKQAEQLDSVRAKFEDEQLKRFQSQYVTSRVLAHEWADRHKYGLPEEAGEDPQQKAKIKPKPGPRATFDSKKHNEVNGVRYRNIFWRFWEPKWSPKKPKLGDGNGQPVSISDEMQGNEFEEDPDDSDAEKARKKRVRDILNDAQAMLDNDGDWEDEEASDGNKENNKQVRFSQPKREPAKPNKLSKPHGVRNAPPGKPANKAAKSNNKPSKVPDQTLALYKPKAANRKAPSTDFRSGLKVGDDDDRRNGAGADDKPKGSAEENDDGKDGQNKDDGKDGQNKDDGKDGQNKDDGKDKGGGDRNNGDDKGPGNNKDRDKHDQDNKDNGDGKDNDQNKDKGGSKDRNKNNKGSNGDDKDSNAAKSSTSSKDEDKSSSSDKGDKQPGDKNGASDGSDKNDKGDKDGKDGNSDKDNANKGDGDKDENGDGGKNKADNGDDKNGNSGAGDKDGKDSHGLSNSDKGLNDGNGNDGNGNENGDGKDGDSNDKKGLGDGDKDKNGKGGSAKPGDKNNLGAGKPPSGNKKNMETSKTTKPPANPYDQYARQTEPNKGKGAPNKTTGRDDKPPAKKPATETQKPPVKKPATESQDVPKSPLKPALKRREPSDTNNTDSAGKSRSEKPTVRITTPPEKKPRKKQANTDDVLYADPSKRPRKPVAVTTKKTIEKEIETTTTKKKKRIVREPSYDEEDEIVPEKKKTNTAVKKRPAVASTVGERPNVPTPDLESDTDDDDEDIFEKARRKYGIVLDSDDDA